jgi:hypothetical protein
MRTLCLALLIALAVPLHAQRSAVGVVEVTAIVIARPVTEMRVVGPAQVSAQGDRLIVTQSLALKNTVEHTTLEADVSGLDGTVLGSQVQCGGGVGCSVPVATMDRWTVTTVVTGLSEAERGAAVALPDVFAGRIRLRIVRGGGA